MGNNSEEDALGVGAYSLKLRGENKLLLHDAFYALRVQFSLISFVSLIKLGFMFCFRPDGLDILYGCNVFGHAMLKNDFSCFGFG